MLKENEKRIFWIVVLAICTISVVTSALSALIFAIRMIGGNGYLEYLFAGIFISLFSVAFLVNVILEVVWRKKYSFKRSLVWLCSLCGSFVLFLIVMLSFLFLVSKNTFWSVLALGIDLLISYGIAFLAKAILNKTTAVVTENNLNEENTKQSNE